MCLGAQGIYDGDGSIDILRRSRGLSNDNIGVSRGQGIKDTSKGSETTTEAVGYQRRDQGICDDNKGVSGGI